MRHRAICVSIAAFLAATADGQQRTFEVASIKSIQDGVGERMERENISATETGVTMRSITLSSAIRWAYSVRAYQIAGPAWLGSQRYTIVAKASGPSSNSDLRAMLQNLLADRFKLTLHRETKDLPVYALVAAKSGPKIQPAKGGETSARPELGGLTFRNFSMADLAERLGGGPFRLDLPVVDRTGISGTFDFTIKLSDNMLEAKRAFESMDRGDEQSVSTFAVLQDQLGLRLQPDKSQVQILVIDRAEKVPVEN